MHIFTNSIDKQGKNLETKEPNTTVIIKKQYLNISNSIIDSLHFSNCEWVFKMLHSTKKNAYILKFQQLVVTICINKMKINKYYLPELSKYKDLLYIFFYY
jgi:hypothetical protein